MVSIEQYDAAELAASQALNYPAIRAFKPAAFALANFPTRVSSEAELIRYSDCMSELEDRKKYLETVLYSRDEADLMLRVSQDIETLTAELFGQPTQPFMGLFTPIYVLRAIQYLAKTAPMAIWEIGPGSGYLGAYILRNAVHFADLSVFHNYRAVDNTQALYLWQDRLFGYLAKGHYKNYALDKSTPTDIPELCASIPWWQFADMYRNSPRADIIVCDAAMGEMDRFAANYVIRIAAEMLKDSSVGAFIFRSIGEQRINPMDYIETQFALAGFKKTACDTVTIFSTRQLRLPSAIPPIGGTARMRRADEFLQFDEAKILDSYRFFDFIKLHG